MIAVFRFQIKTGGDWQDVDDDRFMEELYKHSNRIAPLVKAMLAGSELHLRDNRFRILVKEEV